MRWCAIAIQWLFLPPPKPTATLDTSLGKHQIKPERLIPGFLPMVILLLAITFLAYFPVLRGGFLWDDDDLITNNPLIRADGGLYRFWFSTDAADYYPLTESLWWLEWRACGNNPTGYHIINVLLHAANAVLVWLVLRRLKIPGAWLAGLIFAIHPVNVATAAWISE